MFSSSNKTDLASKIFCPKYFGNRHTQSAERAPLASWLLAPLLQYLGLSQLRICRVHRSSRPCWSIDLACVENSPGTGSAREAVTVSGVLSIQAPDPTPPIAEAQASKAGPASECTSQELCRRGHNSISLPNLEVGNCSFLPRYHSNSPCRRRKTAGAAA